MKFPRHSLLAAVLPLTFACQRAPVVVDPVDPEPIVVEPRAISDAQKGDELNETLVFLRTAYEALKDCDCVTMMTSITEEDRLIGYQVHFRRHGYVKFYIDENATGCSYGLVSMNEAEDGQWYWTYNGEFFAVPGGSRVRVCDDQLISRCKYSTWYLCYRGNLGWTAVGHTTGDDALAGMRAVKTVNHDSDTFHIELSDGRTLDLPWQNADCDVCFGGEAPVCLPGHGIKLRYSVKSKSEWRMDTQIAPSSWKVSKTEDDANSGYFSITAPEGAEPATLSVTISNESGSVCRIVPLSVGYLNVSIDILKLAADGGEAPVEIETDAEYSARVSDDCKAWAAYNSGILKVSKNESKEARVGSVIISDPLGGQICSIRVEQKGVEAYYYGTSIAECLGSGPNNVDYYILKGAVSDLASNGSMTLDDGTGSILVATPSNYEEYYQRLHLPDIKAQVQGHRGETSGHPVLTDVTILGVMDPHAKAPRGWMELPACYDDDGLDFFTHPMTVDGLLTRNYSFYWDYDNYVSRWVAYPLNRGLRSSGSRTDAWDNNLDPLLPRDKQPVLFRAFNKGNTGFSYDRGHQCPSADRYQYDANVETFYGTNMTPQLAALNQNFWAELESRVRSWSNVCDTLYVVTGCTVDESPGYALDNEGKHITVPDGYFKALLAYKKDKSFGHDGYLGLAIFVEHRNYTEEYVAPLMTISIDALEARTGFDFFANLPSAIGSAVADQIEAEDPSTVSWWW